MFLRKVTFLTMTILATSHEKFLEMTPENPLNKIEGMIGEEQATPFTVSIN